MIAYPYNVFFEVATNLSFSKAAEVLYISQPAVSKHIKKLEIDLGVALFERRGNAITLTVPGATLIEHLYKAKNLEKLIQSDVNIIRNKNETKGELRIGGSTTVSLYVLPKVFSSFHKEYPNIKLVLVNRNKENILKALSNREIDLAVVEGGGEVNTFQYTFFTEDEIIPVCSIQSPYAHFEINVEDLKKVPLVMRERGSGTLEVLSNGLKLKGIELRDLQIIARLGGTEALKNYLLEDEVIGFLSRLAVKKELENKTLREIKIRSLKLKRKFTFVLRKGEEISGPTKSLMNIGKSLYN